MKMGVFYVVRAHHIHCPVVNLYKRTEHNQCIWKCQTKESVRLLRQTVKSAISFVEHNHIRSQWMTR